MSSAWRNVGLSYLQYSNICAQAVRNCLKPNLQKEASKRGESMIKVIKWEGGKPISRGGKTSSFRVICIKPVSVFVYLHVVCQLDIEITCPASKLSCPMCRKKSRLGRVSSASPRRRSSGNWMEN